MGVHRRARVVDVDGVAGRLRSVDATDPTHPLGVVVLEGGARVRVPFDVLLHHSDGGYTMTSRWSDFASASDTGATVPVIQQHVTVGVRPAPPKSMRVRRRVVQESREIEVPVWHERVEVERIPINAFVERAPEPRYEGETLVIPCTEEVPVVEVRLRVREELRVRVVREQRVHRETVTLRRHDVDIEPITPDTRRDSHEGEDV